MHFTFWVHQLGYIKSVLLGSNRNDSLQKKKRILETQEIKSKNPTNMN